MDETCETYSQNLKQELLSLAEELRRLSLDAAATYSADMSELADLETLIKARCDDARLSQSSRDHLSFQLSVVQAEQEKLRKATTSLNRRIYDLRQRLHDVLERDLLLLRDRQVSS